MLESVDIALARLYPTRTWGEANDAVADGPGLSEVFDFAEAISQQLNAAAFTRAGGDDEPCDYIYILCVGRTPSIVQVRDQGVPVPDEWLATSPDTSIEELYLRVVISQRVRMAAVQQVALDVTAGAEIDLPQHSLSGSAAHSHAGGRGRGWLICERPRAGVYDAPLLARMQKLVAIMPSYDLLHIDFGEIAHHPPGFHSGVWPRLFDGEPAIANYLFYPQPTTMTSTTFVEALP